MKTPNGYHYVHKSVVAMVIGSEINYVMKQNMLKVKSEETKLNKKSYKEQVITKSKGEHTGAIELLNELPSWIDTIVGDSLYFTAPFIKSVLNTGKDAVIRLEDKTRSVYREIVHFAPFLSIIIIVKKCFIILFINFISFSRNSCKYYLKYIIRTDKDLLFDHPLNNAFNKFNIIYIFN